jgi:4-hydroxy 2-oxovalerate aldolase
MGRGAGNLKTELLLTVLNQKNNLEVDFNALSEVTAVFQDLQEEYKWGTSLPYMVSGANSLPQKQVMEWVSKRYYSINSIIRALSNQTKNQKDNDKFSSFEPSSKYKSVVIIGGGPSAIKHKEAILSFLNLHANDICVIHASSKNATHYKDIKNEQFFCLVGNEGVRLERVFSDFKDFHGQCILPPYPRKMGTYVPDVVRKKTFELEKVDFTNLVDDSHTAIALQAALKLGAGTIFLAGYDGYTGNTIARKDQELFTENSLLFGDIAKKVHCFSLTPTQYENTILSTIYQMIE